MPIQTHHAKARASPSPISSKNLDHGRHPITQDWMHWIRMKAREMENQKKEVSADELFADLQKQKFIPYDPDQEDVEKILYWLTKGILAGPVGSYYLIPAKGETKIKTYFFQHPDPSHPRHQPIAPKAENLTASKMYQDPSTKAVYLEIIIETQDETWSGSLAIEDGELKLKYPITLGRLLKVLPQRI